MLVDEVEQDGTGVVSARKLSTVARNDGWGGEAAWCHGDSIPWVWVGGGVRWWPITRPISLGQGLVLHHTI